jgi:GTP cyclohydrolase I
MNAPFAPVPLTDVQSSPDLRQMAIDKVGIRAIRHPVQVVDKAGATQHSIATFEMYVFLPQSFKGTHMSRFVQLLNERTEAISVQNFEAMLREMVARLDAPAGYLEMRFPFFISKAAPVSGVRSLMDYEITLRGEIRQGDYLPTLKVQVPVTSLCPCSKEISAYGAHNQRSHVTVTAHTRQAMWIEDLIRLVEDQASAELWGLLKRPDEKFVTERAYDNPKFVEDMVRDVARQLDAQPEICAFVVEAENFESIHNHSAYALIERDKRQPPGAT